MVMSPRGWSPTCKLREKMTLLDKTCYILTATGKDGRARFSQTLENPFLRRPLAIQGRLSLSTTFIFRITAYSDLNQGYHRTNIRYQSNYPLQIAADTCEPSSYLILPFGLTVLVPQSYKLIAFGTVTSIRLKSNMAWVRRTGK